MQSITWAPLAPVLVLVAGLVFVLLADLMLPLGVRRMVLPAVSAVTCLGAAGSAAWLRGGPGPPGTFCSSPGSGSASRCAYVLGDTAGFLTVVLCLAAAAVLVLALAQLRADVEGVTPAGEYCLVLLAATIGAVIVAGSRDLITLVVGLETLTVPLYAAVAFRRGSNAGPEAALTLLVVSVTSTALMLLGIGFLYGLTGTMHVDALAEVLTAGGGVGDLALADVAVVLLLAGLAFKVGAVPFHVWAPSTYQGAPIPVAAYLSSVSKAGGIAGLIVVLPAVSAGSPAAATWIALLAAVSMTVGNLVAMRQRHLVRLLAWSGIAQTGYLLVGLAVLSGRSDQALSGAGATLAYLAVYVLMTVGAFACVAAINGTSDTVATSDTATTDTGRAVSEGPSVESVRGLATEHPRIAAAFALFLIGLAGLPPALLGLFGKVVVVRAAFTGDAGWLGILVALNTVLAFVYYLRVAAALFARTGAAKESASPLATTLVGARPGRSVPAAMGVLVAALALAALVAGFWPDLIIGAAPLLSPFGE
ncbi:MAG: NADH-quinone oxidoreductase subunit N [Geodermatophilaceae bacterium]|nr:NADH-quinone oxidoreductase subunit N [Geodermatophilaceae bacterium]